MWFLTVISELKGWEKKIARLYEKVNAYIPLCLDSLYNGQPRIFTPIMKGFLYDAETPYVIFWYKQAGSRPSKTGGTGDGSPDRTTFGSSQQGCCAHIGRKTMRPCGADLERAGYAHFRSHSNTETDVQFWFWRKRCSEKGEMRMRSDWCGSYGSQWNTKRSQ